jgi:hypothetical protein
MLIYVSGVFKIGQQRVLTPRCSESFGSAIPAWVPTILTSGLVPDALKAMKIFLPVLFKLI